MRESNILFPKLSFSVSSVWLPLKGSPNHHKGSPLGFLLAHPGAPYMVFETRSQTGTARFGFIHWTFYSGCIYVPARSCTFFVTLGWGSSSAWARYGGEHSPKLESFPILIRLSFEEHNWRGVWQPRKAGHLSPRSLAKIQAALAKRRLDMKPLVLTTRVIAHIYNIGQWSPYFV